MAKYFTPGTTPPGFYATRPEINSVEITDDLWRELLTAQFAGQQIITSEEGVPIAVDFPQGPDS